MGKELKMERRPVAAPVCNACRARLRSSLGRPLPAPSLATPPCHTHSTLQRACSLPCVLRWWCLELHRAPPLPCAPARPHAAAACASPAAAAASPRGGLLGVVCGQAAGGRGGARGAEASEWKGRRRRVTALEELLPQLTLCAGFAPYPVRCISGTTAARPPKPAHSGAPAGAPGGSLPRRRS